MSDAMSLLATTLATTAALMLALWCVSVWRRDASIVDIFWGAGFVVVAWTTRLVADGSDARGWLLAALTTVWGLRLAGYLAWRNLGKGEDFRYQAMRRRHGSRFPLVSLYLVFGLQGVLMWVVSLPVQAGQVPATPDGLIWLDLVGIGFWAVGLFFETVGDLQLARFKKDPAAKGKVMDRGLWRYTRHPNYFGDFMVWWGLFLVALATGDAWWTVIGPVVMSVLLIRVSGAALLEKSLKNRRAGYDEYVRRTSAFFPRPPRT
jgi:steroid 5-alpha reductase family enzyme